MKNHVPSSAIAQALRAIADAIEAQPGAVATTDDFLTIAEVHAEFGMGRGALDARQIPKARMGRAYRWRRSDILTAIQVAPPRPPRKTQPIGETEDPLDAMIASGELVARGRR